MTNLKEESVDSLVELVRMSEEYFDFIIDGDKGGLLALLDKIKKDRVKYTTDQMAALVRYYWSFKDHSEDTFRESLEVKATEQGLTGLTIDHFIEFHIKRRELDYLESHPNVPADWVNEFVPQHTVGFPPVPDPRGSTV